MARNGSDFYSLPPGSVVSNGDTSDATDINVPLQDLAADANIARPISAGGTGATSQSSARANLGVQVGSDVQAHSALLDDFAGVTPTDGGFLVGNGTTWVTESGSVARTSLGIPVLSDDETLADASPTQSVSERAAKAYVDGFTSAAQTITSGGLLTIAHGMGQRPGIVLGWLECVTPEGGYSIGDVVNASLISTGSTVNRQNSLHVDDTNVYMRFSDESNCFATANKDTGAVLNLTNSSWQFIVEARR